MRISFAGHKIPPLCETATGILNQNKLKIVETTLLASTGEFHANQPRSMAEKVMSGSLGHNEPLPIPFVVSCDNGTKRELEDYRALR